MHRPLSSGPPLRESTGAGSNYTNFKPTRTKRPTSLLAAATYRRWTMDSGPSPSSFPHSSDVGGSSNTSRFRLSELLNSSSNERTRTSSLKGRQAQRDSSRSSRIYDLHASTPVHTFEGSPIEPNSSLKRSRTSFLATAQDALMLKKFGRKKKPLTIPPSSLLPDVIEITATETKRGSVIIATRAEDEERERLRDAAAQSIGLDPDLMSMSPTNPLGNHDFGCDNDHESDYERDPEVDNPTPGSHRVSRESSYVSSTVWANELSSSHGHRGRVGSISIAAKSSNACTPALTPTIPVYPTTVAGLNNSTQLSRVLPKYYPSNHLLKFSLTKQWKNRFIVMSSPVQPNQALSSSHSSRPTPTTAPTVSYLHLFKSNGPSEKELERLEINEDSVVFVNENNEEISGRRNVLRVGGVDCGAMKKDLNVEEGGRTIWLLQVSDQQELQRWISAIKNAVLGQRSVRAGLGFPTSNYGGVEPRGDMDVMLSMRAQGLISTRNKGMSSNSGSGNNINGNSNSGTQSSKPQPPSASATPKLPISTLKGFFSAPNRPRTPSLSNGSVKSDEPSPNQPSFNPIPHPIHHHPPPTTSAGTHILNRLRGNSEARPLSPLGYTPSVTSISTNTHNAGGNPGYSVSGAADSGLSSTELERRILPDLIDTTASGTSGSTWTMNQRKQSIISQQSTGLNGLMNSVSSPLQPPPWKKQTMTPSSVTQSLPQSQVDLSEPDPTTYRYLHTNMSAVESFGVHNTHPPGRRSGSGARPSLDINSSRESYGSGSVNGSGIGAGGSAKGSLGVGAGGEKKTRPPSWNSASSITESITSGPKRWSRQGVLPKRLTPPSGALPAIPTSSMEEGPVTTPRLASPHPYSFDRDSSPSRSSSYSAQNSQPNSNANSPQNGFSATFLKRQSGSSFQSAASTSNLSSQTHTRTSTGSGNGSVGSYISRSALSIQNRLSLAPPQRPAPNTALPPTPTEQDSRNSSPGVLSSGPPSPSPSSPRSSFRENLTQRALRLSLAGVPQKAPPITNLPPRPDEHPFIEGHRRSGSGGGVSVGGATRPTTLYTIPGSPSPTDSGSNLVPPVFIEKERQQNPLNLNLRQRLRMLSAPASAGVSVDSPPATSPRSSAFSAQLLAADQRILKPQMEGEDGYGSVHTRLLIGEPITTMQNDPSFLLMTTPAIPPPAPPTRLWDHPSPSSSMYLPSNPSSPLPTQTQFPTGSTFPPPQYPAHNQRSPQLAPLPVPPRSPFRQLPKPPSPAPSQNSRSHPLPPSPPPTQLETTPLSPPPWKAAKRSSVIPTMPPKDVDEDASEVEQRDDRPPPAFMDSPPLLAPSSTPPVPFTPLMSSADSITNLSI